MKEFIEKLISRLEEKENEAVLKAPNTSDISNIEYQKWMMKSYGFKDAIEIVNQLAEEYKLLEKVEQLDNGWIPCSERLPEKLEPVNITWVNRKPEPYYANIKDIPFVATAFYYKEKWWWYSCVCEDYLSEYGESECDAVDKDIEMIAWQPLPEPYLPKPRKKQPAAVLPAEEKLLSPVGEYAAKFAENHGMSVSEAMEHPTVKAYAAFQDAVRLGLVRIEKAPQAAGLRGGVNGETDII